MKKIAILGCENSHAHAFLGIMKNDPAFADIEVVGVYSNEREAAEKLHTIFGVPVLEDYADAVGKVDGLVITARHGDNHYLYAKPYLASGIPMFIDKPITNSEEDVIAFMKDVKAHGVRICGGSSLKHDDMIRKLKKEREEEFGGKTKGGYVRAPYDAENAYGGFHFYAPHMTEMVCEIFGRHPHSVLARQNGNDIHVLFRYEDFDCVGLYCDRNYMYYATRLSEKNASGGEISVVADTWYTREFSEFYELLIGGAQQISCEDLISPVFIQNAVVRSLESGKEEKVNVPAF